MKKLKEVRPFKGRLGVRPKKSLTASKSVRSTSGTKRGKVKKR